MINFPEYLLSYIPVHTEFNILFRNVLPVQNLARLISDNFTNLVENIYINSGYRSDQSAVVIEFNYKLSTFEGGRGLWKFNNYLLYDTKYVDKV